MYLYTKSISTFLYTHRTSSMTMTITDVSNNNHTNQRIHQDSILSSSTSSTSSINDRGSEGVYTDNTEYEINRYLVDHNRVGDPGMCIPYISFLYIFSLLVICLLI